MTVAIGEGIEPRIESRGGALITKYKPVFSENGKNVFCCCGQEVKSYSVKTGRCVGVLRGHTNSVTGVHLHPTNPLQVITCSLDKTIITWDAADCVKLKTYHVGFPVESMVVSRERTRDGLVCYAVCQSAKNRFAVQKVVPPRDGQSERAEAQTIIDPVSDALNALAVGHENRYVAAIEGHNLVVYGCKEKKIRKHHTMDRRVLTCVAAHPCEERLATGCADGSIVVWWNLAARDESPVHTSMHHWHSLSLLTLTFTREGSYLLSGGHECVLVVWQDNMQSRDFLPRLGAPIRHVATSRDNTQYVTAHTDNMIQIIDNSLKVCQIVQGLTRSYLTLKKTSEEKAQKNSHKHSKAKRKSREFKDAVLPTSFPRTGLHLDPRSNAMVLNGRPGHLQFYHLQRDELLFNLDIVGQNYVSPDDLSQPLTVTEVDACALSPDGDWLATAQSRDDHVYTLDLCLKFWKFDKSIQSYSLNTTVDLAHQQPITSLVFRPLSRDERVVPRDDNEPRDGEESRDDNNVPRDDSNVSRGDHMCVSTSRDGKFKLWTMRDDTDIYRENRCWDCESVGFYRDQPASLADFSQDGSVLAVAFSDLVTLWNPDTNALHSTLECRQPVTQLKVGCHECRHLLVACTRSVLMVWNILTLSVQWVADCSVVTLARDVTSSNMAAFTDQRELFIFSPNNSEPVFRSPHVSRHDVTAAIFIPHSTSSPRHQWMAGARLFFMDEDQKLQTLIYEEDRVGTTEADKVEASLPQSLLSLALSAKLPASEATDGKRQAKPQPAYKVFEAPAHTLPPVSSLATPFLDSLLVRITQSHEELQEDHSSNASSDMEVDNVDSDADLPQTAARRPKSDGKDATELTDKAETNVLDAMAALNVADCSWLGAVVKDVTILSE